MKKIIIIGGIAIVISVFIAMRQEKKNASHAGALRIALFTPVTHPALEEVEQGFKETVEKCGSKTYVFTTFNANGNRSLLRAQAEEMVSGSYDLVFTMGALCSQTVAELLRKKGIKMPHVFAAVDGAEFAHSLTALNQSSTGVYVQLDYTKEMDMMHALKPDIKNMLLVYDPTHGTGLEKYKKEIERYIQKFGITLHSVEIYQSNEIQQKVAASLPTMDVVLVLVDNTVVAGIDALIALCNRYGVTLLASDLASGKKGAALAYGITEYESGSGAAQKVCEILEHGKNPQELPISAITKFRVAVNRATMQAQHLNVDEKTLEEFEQSQKEHHD
jgi:putative ABC transport system substrate-binding protein